MQRALEAARAAGEVADTVLVLEHPPVYTKGRRASADELPMGEDWYRMQGIEVSRPTAAAGSPTTAPASWSPIRSSTCASSPTPDDVHAFVRHMERAMIAALGDFGVEAGLIDGLTGVWVGDEPPPAGDARKIGSIGIHVAAGSPPTGWRSTSPTTCSRSSGWSRAGSRRAG